MTRPKNKNKKQDRKRLLFSAFVNASTSLWLIILFLSCSRKAWKTSSVKIVKLLCIYSLGKNGSRE